MSFGRRPPPPPPMDEPAPPVLPPRIISQENKPQMESSSPAHPARTKNFVMSSPEDDTEDMYEQPTPQSSSDIISAKRGDISSFSSSRSQPAADKSPDSDGWSDSEWDDTVNVDVPSSSLSDEYLMPEGGNVCDEYQLPDDTQAPAVKSPKPPITSRFHQITGSDNLKSPPPFAGSKVSAKAVTNGSTTDKRNKMVLPLPTATNKPIPPPVKPSTDQYKPVPKPKPPTKPPDQDNPKLPPRPKEKDLSVPVPKLEPKRDSLSDDNTSAGSASSELESKVLPNTPNQQQNKKFGVQVLPAVHVDIKLKNMVREMAEKRETKSNQGKAKQNEADTENNIYDDGVSEVLSQFDWYHGELDREAGVRKVKQLSENGAFLIRASKDNSHPYTLVVILDGKVYNLKIRLRSDTRFAIGNYKSDEVSFSTVPELVKHHKENNIKLAEGGAVRLTRTPKK